MVAMGYPRNPLLALLLSRLRARSFICSLPHADNSLRLWEIGCRLFTGPERSRDIGLVGAAGVSAVGLRLGGAPSTCRVGLVGCRRRAVGIAGYCRPTLQISFQTWNVWVLEALCSTAVT